MDAIIGCGQRNGKKYFLVRYKGRNFNEIIDWETAKRYSLEVMDYFGSRLAWSPLENIVDSDEMNVDIGDEQPQIEEEGSNSNPILTGQLDNIPNEIEYSK